MGPAIDQRVDLVAVGRGTPTSAGQVGIGILAIPGPQQRAVEDDLLTGERAHAHQPADQTHDEEDVIPIA